MIARAIDIGSTNANLPTSGTPSQKLFNQALSELKEYHYREQSLREDSLKAIDRFDAVVALSQYVRAIPAKLLPPALPKNFDPTPGVRLPEDGPTQDLLVSSSENGVAPSGEATIDQVDSFIGEVAEVDVETTAEIGRIKRMGDGDANTIVMTAANVPIKPGRLALVNAAIAVDRGFQEIVEIIAKRTLRHPQNPGDYVASKLGLLRTARELTDRISIANRFALPMIYGSLGAALFCLVRVLTPALSDLGPARAFLRILFGAFAAMTLSMLFIPANVFSINDQSNPTLIFLACFLFGYSFDAVLSALHRLEAFLQGRLQTKDSN